MLDIYQKIKALNFKLGRSMDLWDDENGRDCGPVVIIIANIKRQIYLKVFGVTTK